MRPLLSGQLHVYDVEKRLVAFESGSDQPLATVIFVGRLGDGLAAIPVLPRLSEELANHGCSLLQPLTRSSYLGWLAGDVDRDTDDLRQLERYLRVTLGRRSKLVLLGHSTGCQDAVRYMQRFPDTSYDGVILQAPVSDREATSLSMTPQDLDKTVKAAQDQIAAGRGAYPLPPEICDLAYPDMKGGPEAPHPVTAQRWHSLAAKGGKEDYFSSDLTDDQLAQAFEGIRKLKKPCCILMGEKDEFYPSSVHKEKLLARFERARDATGKSYSAILKGANHAIEAEDAQREFIEKILLFVTQEV